MHPGERCPPIENTSVAMLVERHIGRLRPMSRSGVGDHGTNPDEEGKKKGSISMANHAPEKGRKKKRLTPVGVSDDQSLASVKKGEPRDSWGYERGNG